MSVPKEPEISLTVRFSGNYLGLLTHYHNKRSVPCMGEKDCLPVVHRTRTIWKGYAPGDGWDCHQRLWIPVVLEITELMEHMLVGRDLRGEVWMFFRSKLRGPVQGAFSEKQQEKQCRKCFSIAPIVERFYHQSNLLLGVPNPIPPKTFLEPLEGDAPRLVRELETPLPEPAKADAKEFITMAERARRFANTREASKNGTH
jgi:hypothetical protein